MYTNYTVTKNDNSTVTIEGELPHEELHKHREHVIKELGQDISIDGFRKGHVPEKIVIERVGEQALFTEMAEHALSEHYPKMLMHHDIDAIGRPDITITKLAAGNPLGFKITTAVFPKFDLPSYKDLAQKHVKEHGNKEVVVTDEDVQIFIDNALRQYRDAENKKNGVETKTDDALPELTDDLVKNFGTFKDVDDFKQKIREGIMYDKRHKAQDALRIDIMNDILAHTNVTLPDILIEAELDKMYAQFRGDIERFGIKPDEYMEHLKKTEADLRKEWRSDAEKSAKQQLILHEIGLKENIQPSPEEIKKETDHILEHYPDAKRPNVEAYVATTLGNQKVLEFLEKQKNA
ncbi:hypothetical protein IPJ70_03350 [Candidatus Campbellbacteria bacterium]|nr:MAG: hypothetical protein IPJ70_03350 [Candidatus Campbellbacteria bacterium]